MPTKVLIINDNQSELLSMKKILTNFDILNALNIKKALDILENSNDINLIILDLKMTQTSGFEFLQKIKESDKYKGIRCIILTNHDDIENEIEGLKLGAIDFIRRPFHLESLRARIDVHILLLTIQDALNQKLDEQKISLDVLLEQAPIGIAISQHNAAEHFAKEKLRINQKYEEITGCTKEELIQTGWAAITHPDDLIKDLEKFNQLKQGDINSYHIEKRIFKPDGKIIWVYLTVATLERLSDTEFNYISLLQDITHKKELELEREYNLYHDKVTGLYNREYFNNLLSNDLKTHSYSKIALIGINLSSIQLIAVNYGYLYSLDLIRQTANALNEFVSSNHQLFVTHETRFLFYMTNYNNRSDVDAFCEQISARLKEVFHNDKIGGGIGVLELQECDRELEIDMISRKLLKASEKSNGLFSKEFEIYYYDDLMDEESKREIIIRNALLDIVNGNNSDNELYVQYQPIYDLKQNKITGFEALGRLHTKELGNIPPLDFISIAEKTKIIIPIGEIITEKSLKFLSDINNEYPNIGVTINVSAIQMYTSDFVTKLLNIIDKYQVNPKNVGLELTESIIVVDYEQINTHLDCLKEEGIQIYIDDFGTGYSSLAREIELKMDFLKIDKYFIDKLIYRDHDKCITGDIISMAHKLGHQTVAEGVEDKIQLEYLRKNNCDRIQGYYYSKPLSKEDAVKFLIQDKKI
ncbi:two-component system response regulator [Acholeplasma hippikon]|uniref:Cyclic di-GMP phosphodiesterase Gmr n=1 Tax=Acholeplasma hippikon TaxID=264636 RepID=A0A449BJ42_9MOLU|nr:EAL domain-containing protein [Acholeplasma hippikon]VEU82450.1 Cyclic di-GMP phosphodiesterase Gmr [Acholeplasma hippikon]